MTSMDFSRAWLGVLLFAAACGGALSEGKSEFKKGRYAEAKETFLRTEGESRTWDDGRRAQYSLYRGLTHSALGDRGAATLWLREAKAVEDAHPGTMSAEDVTRLTLGLEALGPEAAAPER